MYCLEIAFCPRYFVDGGESIATTFLVLDAEPRQIDDAMAKYQVWSEDFQIYLEASAELSLEKYFLLISTDGKYASLTARFPEGDNMGDRLGLFGAMRRHAKFEERTLSQILLEFEAHLFKEPELFSRLEVKLPPLKLKQRFRLDAMRYENMLDLVRAVERALEQPQDAADDVLALALMQAGNKPWMNFEKVIAAKPLLDELIRRHRKDLWNGSMFFDFSGTTPQEITARRIRAERNLHDLEHGEFFQYMDYETREKAKEVALRKIKTEELAEVALIASGKNAGDEKRFVMELVRRADAMHQVVY